MHKLGTKVALVNLSFLRSPSSPSCHAGWWGLSQEGALSQAPLFWPPKCAAVVPFGPMRTARALLPQLSVREDEKLPSLPCCPGPAVRTPQQRAGCQAFPLACGLLSLRLARLWRSQPQHTQGAPPPKKGEGAGWRHPVFPCPLPFTACPSLAPYLAIPLVAPSPSLHGLGGPRADPLPCPWLHEWPRRSSVVRRRPNKARWPTGPPTPAPGGCN